MRAFLSRLHSILVTGAIVAGASMVGRYVSAYKNLTCASRVPSVTFASSAPIIATAQAPRRHRVGGAIGEGRRRRERQAGREGARGGDSLL